MNKLIIALLVMMTISTQATNAGAAINSDTLGVANLAGLANNRYFKLGIQAQTSGLAMFSVTIPCEPTQTLPMRMNEAHLGIGHSGWKLVGQSPIDSSGKTTDILLTYGR